MKKPTFLITTVLTALVMTGMPPVASAHLQLYGTTELVIPLRRPIVVNRLVRAVQVPDTPHMRVLAAYLDQEVDLDAPYGSEAVRGPLLIVQLPIPLRVGDFTYTELHLPDTLAVRVLLADRNFDARSVA